MEFLTGNLVATIVTVVLMGINEMLLSCIIMTTMVFAIFVIPIGFKLINRQIEKE